MTVTAITTVRKVGGSLVATIPKDVVEILHLHDKEPIEIEVSKPKASFFGMLKGKIKPFNEKEDRMKSRYD